jgi:DNA-binding PadR family transcriptional regulator
MRRMSPTLVAVLQAVADGTPYGFEIIDRTNLPSGTVYPALARLERDGFLRSSWEDDAAAFAEGRPARRNYRVTAAGSRALAAAVAEYRALLPMRPARARGPS